MITLYVRDQTINVPDKLTDMIPLIKQSVQIDADPLFFKLLIDYLNEKTQESQLQFNSFLKKGGFTVLIFAYIYIDFYSLFNTLNHLNTTYLYKST